MTREEREVYQRQWDERTRLLEEQMARLQRRSAERREQQERWERSLLGRLSRRLGLT